jgi:ribonuclease P protein component
MSDEAPRKRFAKASRLRKPGDFAHVRQAGRPYSSTSLILSVARQATADRKGVAQPERAARVGFVVTKRIGNAVVRNRIRRQLREVMRYRLEQLAPGWDLVVIARQPATGGDIATFESELNNLLRRAKVLAPGSEMRAV